MNTLHYAAGLLSGMVLLTTAHDASAEDGGRYEVYGFIKTDAGIMTRAVDPSWFDVMLPSKLPQRADQFGKGQDFYTSVRSSRLGVRAGVPVAGRELHNIVEFDMFGVGRDVGMTTFHLRQFYGEWGPVGAGQTWSVFVDPDAIPGTLDHVGPPGVTVARIPQIRWVAIDRDHARLRFGLERPGWNNDFGMFSGRPEVANIASRASMPDVTASGRVTQDWGYVQLGGVARRITWDDLANEGHDGSAEGWGVSASSNLKGGKRDVLKLEATYGRGIESYFNDAPTDVAIRADGDSLRSISADPLATLGFSAFDEHKWTDRWSTTLGYSQVHISTSAQQLPNAFRLGQYALANLIYRPAAPVQLGIGLGWWRRANNSDGYAGENLRLAASFKYLFSAGLHP